MSDSRPHSSSETVGLIVEQISAPEARRHLILQFAGQLFGDIEELELASHAPEVMADLAREAYATFDTRSPGMANVRVRDASTDKWNATIIEIANDDMPFLLDSVLSELVDRGMTPNITAHPIIRTARDAAGRLVALGDAPAPSDAIVQTESFILIETDEMVSDAMRDDLQRALEGVMRQVRIVVDDWSAMLERLGRAIASYRSATVPVSRDALEEAIRFLEWIENRNFIFLGMRNYTFDGTLSPPELRPDPASGLGVLRDPQQHVLRQPGDNTQLSPEIVDLFLTSDPLIVTKANLRSNIHRRVQMDVISVKLYDDGDQPSGEIRIVGLFTSSAYTRSAEDIPLLRRKVSEVLGRSGFRENSHSWRALRNVLETYPRDELFQMDVDLLEHFATGIFYLDSRPRTRVFVRRDQFERFVSVLVYVSRDRYNTTVRERICEYLEGEFGGTMAALTPFFTSGPMVRLHVVIWRDETAPILKASDNLDSGLERIVRTWREDVRDRLREVHGRQANPLIAKYFDAFSAGYEEYNTPERALHDIAKLETLTPQTPVAVDFCRDESCSASQIRVSLYRIGEPIPLSRRVPMFENMGFAAISERTFPITLTGSQGLMTAYLHDITLETRNGTLDDVTPHKDRLEECFLRVWNEDAGNDSYNGLVLAAGLTWRETAIFRAYGSYLRQTGAPFGQAYLAATLRRHNGITRCLAMLFANLFDPARPEDVATRDALAGDQIAEIESRLSDVASLDEDRILRRFVTLIRATKRTNFYQSAARSGHPLLIAFKLASREIDGLPAPRPFAEIFIHSPRVEGVHLRGGTIARGGIRWSDRPQDFRFEVLGLAKAQQVKNAVIIPQGAKGGFYPVRLKPNASREDRMDEAIACYKLFISGLLAVTDNLRDERIIPPKDLVRHDGDDAYLVVAADKGTATFSDIANGISQDHEFWLDDAFASGGSAGYDHKKMGITARGAWEAVKRHFREINHDIQTQPFSVIGVGDMSGDVFGNGMLLSRQTRLVAAFDHRDIFIDPQPDIERGWDERKRLFDLPRSSWQDYDRSLISPGGGVFSRAAKSIALSQQMRDLTGLGDSHAAPNDLIRALLRAPVDLLWFGGIGTFIRAESESNEQVNDRANDALRITASEVGARVIGEGANLGITQRGRIAFAMAGGRVNTDAIDNSAGVNSSDFEVNIKIALGKAERAGRITRDERNTILASMTDQVAQSCLRNNYLQSLAISLGARRGLEDLGFQARLMDQLEKAGLDREVEDLPSPAEISERRKQAQPLTRPELAVLLAYAKIAAYDTLINSPVCRDPFLSNALQAYFPQALRERFAAEIEAHPLRREIIATQLANTIINRGGSTLLLRLTEETGRAADEIAYAFAAAMEVFGLEALYLELDALDNRIDGAHQLDLYLMVQDIVRRQTAWFLRHGNFSDGLSAVIEHYRTGLSEIGGRLDELMSPQQRERLERRIDAFSQYGVPRQLAQRLARLSPLGETPDIVLGADDAGVSVADIAPVMFGIFDYFRLDDLREAAEAIAESDFFERLAVNTTMETAAAAVRGIAAQVMRAPSREDGFAGWRKTRESQVERARESVASTIDTQDPSLAKLTVAVSHLRDLAGS